MTTERTIHSPDRRVRKYRIVKRIKSALQVAWEEQWPGDKHWKRRTKRLTYDEMHNAYTGAPPI